MKKKLFVSAMSLIMAIVLMTSTSFAWFTVSTAPEITSVKVQMGTMKNLEIANITATNKTNGPSEPATTDATQTNKYGYWGSTATFAEAAAGIQFPITKVDSNVVKTVEFDATGRLTANEQTLTLTDGTMADDGTNTATAAVAAGDGTTQTLVVASSYTVWLRTNVDQANLSAAVDVSGVTASGFKNDSSITGDDVVVAMKNASGFTALSSTAADTGIDLTKNTAKQVTVYVFVKGDDIVAEDMTAATAPSISGIKVSFSSDEVSNAAPTP